MFRISFCIKSPEAFIFGDVGGDVILQEGLKGVNTRTSGILPISESGFLTGEGAVRWEYPLLSW